MTKIVGIRFRNAGKIYYFDPADFELEVPMHVIVETARGIEMGTVLIAPKEVEDDKVIQPLKPVIRIATEEDENTIESNKEKEKEAFKICKEKILKHELEMKLVDAEYTFDGNKLLFYFTADGRIDFRELVKDLAAVFRTRIELRQIGVRDETKILGGIGICGRELCCKSYLSDFVPVSIKMAKEQNLSLNPTKISGACGRLMCCLKNEQDTYEYLNSRLPNVGDRITMTDGASGEVKSVSVLRQLVKVVVENGDEKELREYSVDDIKNNGYKRKDVKVTEEELAELKELEDVNDNNDSVYTEKADNNNKKDKKHDNSDNKRQNNHDYNRENSRESRRENNQETNRESRRENNRETNWENSRENNRETSQENNRENNRETGRENSRVNGHENVCDNNEGREYNKGRDSRKNFKEHKPRENKNAEGWDNRNNKDDNVKSGDNKRNFRNKRNRNNRGKHNGNKQQSNPQ